MSLGVKKVEEMRIKILMRRFFWLFFSVNRLFSDGKNS